MGYWGHLELGLWLTGDQETTTEQPLRRTRLWCQGTPPGSHYPWRNVESYFLYILRINLTPIKVNGKAAIYLSGNKIRSQVAGIRARSRKSHWRLRRWLWFHAHFSTVVQDKMVLLCHCDPRACIQSQITGKQAGLVGVSFQMAQIPHVVYSVFPHNAFSGTIWKVTGINDKWPQRSGVAVTPSQFFIFFLLFFLFTSVDCEEQTNFHLFTASGLVPSSPVFQTSSAEVSFKERENCFQFVGADHCAGVRSPDFVPEPLVQYEAHEHFKGSSPK